MTDKYPNLLSKGTIGTLETRNKTVMCAMGINQSDKGFVNDAVINHYAERAKGGIGLIMIEVTCVDAPVGLNTSNMLVADDDKYIPGLTKLTDAIHVHGAKCMLQLSHTGRGSRRKITGHQPVAPSAVAMPYSFMMGLGNEEPRALTIKEIQEIEDKYAQAALRAKKAGFDGVEIHSVGYYMGQQFLSSTANVRTDEYGGNPENRVRFHLNIIGKIKKLCGEDFPIVVKLSAVEQGEDAGITMQDGMYYAKRFQDAGADAIEVLAGTWKKEAGMEDMPDSASIPSSRKGQGDAVRGMPYWEMKTMIIPSGKQVIVVGGGVAGVEAARIASIRGHRVSLYERSGQIGGQIFQAMAPPHKENMKPLIAYLEKQLSIHNVEVHLNAEITAEEIISRKPDAVVCATGVRPSVLPIPGFDRAVHAKDILDGGECKEKAVIIGGGSVGCETAEYLAEQGKKVTVIEMLDTMAEKMTNVARTILMGHLKGLGVELLTSCKCKEITEDTVVCELDGRERRIPADTVIAAVGDRPNDSLYQELQGKVEELYNVGDSACPDSIAAAVSQGYYCGRNI